jgi:hypothetical protein
MYIETLFKSTILSRLVMPAWKPENKAFGDYLNFQTQIESFGS